jgi:hypothetical protein
MVGRFAAGARRPLAKRSWAAKRVASPGRQRVLVRRAVQKEELNNMRIAAFFSVFAAATLAWRKPCR